jgi:hypothetical protein
VLCVWEDGKMSKGWIKLHRELVDWEYYQDSNTMRVFLHVLISANHKAAKWQGISIERGQFVTSYDHLAKALGLTIQNVRTSISKLKKSENLTVKSTNKFTIISVCNYDTYQSQEEATNNQSNNPLTNDQQTTNNKQEGIRITKKEIDSTSEDFTASPLTFEEAQANRKKMAQFVTPMTFE